MGTPGKLLTLPRSTTANPRVELDAELCNQARVALIRGMRARGWTVERLARECAADFSTACRWLSGESRVPGKALVAVGAVDVANDNGRRAA